MKKMKIDFSKLIGNFYSTEVKMNLLNWMLYTGKIHTEWVRRWTEVGVSKLLFNYSANNYDFVSSLSEDNRMRDYYFDAIFARVLYGTTNKATKNWRENESIYPNKYRMLSFNLSYDIYELFSLIRNIYKLNNSILKKEFAHPDYTTRTEPKIIDINIFTLGNGWTVQYQFSFKEFKYEPGWTKGFIQERNESIPQFLERAYNEISESIKTI